MTTLVEVLSTVNHLTGFLDAFEPRYVKYARPRPPDKTFLAGIVGYGIVKLLTILPSPWHNDRRDARSQTKPTSGEAADMTPPADPAVYLHPALRREA
jgi:hypothetical protein